MNQYYARNSQNWFKTMTERNKNPNYCRHCGAVVVFNPDKESPCAMKRIHFDFFLKSLLTLEWGWRWASETASEKLISRREERFCSTELQWTHLALPPPSLPPCTTLLPESSLRAARSRRSLAGPCLQETPAFFLQKHSNLASLTLEHFLHRSVCRGAAAAQQEGAQTGGVTTGRDMFAAAVV